MLAVQVPSLSGAVVSDGVGRPTDAIETNTSVPNVQQAASSSYACAISIGTIGWVNQNRATFGQEQTR